MSDELKPCPFCGNEPAPYWKGVGCATSGCLLNGLHLDADKWNRRAQPAEAEGVERWNGLKLAAEVAEEDGPWEPRLGMTDCETAFAQSASPSKVLELIAALSAVTAERDGLAAARMAYANEFAPDENGDPDVGSVHANIRAMKAERDQSISLTADYIALLGEAGVQIDQLHAEVEALRKDAERYRWLRDSGGSTFRVLETWALAKGEFYDAAIDAALAAKEA